MKYIEKLRGKTIIPNKLVFGGGYPKFYKLPKIRKWGKCVSIFWFGLELVYLG